MTKTVHEAAYEWARKLYPLADETKLGEYWAALATVKRLRGHPNYATRLEQAAVYFNTVIKDLASEKEPVAGAEAVEAAAGGDYAYAEHTHDPLLHFQVKEKELRDHLAWQHARPVAARKASWRSCVATHNEAHEDFAEVPDNERDRAQGRLPEQRP